MADLDPKVYEYLFIRVLPGNGTRQPLICTFFQKLYEACLAADIPPSYDFDNIERVNTILQRLNFNTPTGTGLQPPRPGRTVNPSSRPKKEQKSRVDEHGRASGAGQKT